MPFFDEKFCDYKFCTDLSLQEKTFVVAEERIFYSSEFNKQEIRISDFCFLDYYVSAEQQKSNTTKTIKRQAQKSDDYEVPGMLLLLLLDFFTKLCHTSSDYMGNARRRILQKNRLGFWHTYACIS